MGSKAFLLSPQPSTNFKQSLNHSSIVSIHQQQQNEVAPHYNEDYQSQVNLINVGQQQDRQSPSLPLKQKRRVTLGVRGYADELFQMRINQNEIKSYKRNMVDTGKFEFQKQHVTAPRVEGDYSVREELLNELSKEMQKKKDQLSVDWEYVDEVQRIKTLRRINLLIQKQNHGQRLSPLNLAPNTTGEKSSVTLPKLRNVHKLASTQDVTSILKLKSPKNFKDTLLPASVNDYQD